MEITNNPKEVFNELKKLFPDAKCELNYNNVYELTIATILSAQATDKSVNNVTPILFKKYPDVNKLSNAMEDEVIEIIKPVGLSKTKAHNIIALAKVAKDKYQGIIPNSFDDLVNLPGVGRKTANVILAEGFDLPGLAVDTHVARVSNRLALSRSTNPEVIEQELKGMFEKEDWGLVHLTMLFFGRYMCKAKNPECNNCPFKNKCNKGSINYE